MEKAKEQGKMPAAPSGQEKPAPPKLPKSG